MAFDPTGFRNQNGVKRPVDPKPNRPAVEHDLSVVSPQPVASVGGGANGADERMPEAPRTSGYSTNVPMPDNHGPRNEGGLGEQGLGF